MIEGSFPVTEAILPARTREATPMGIAGLELDPFVSEACGATGFSTGIARFKPGASLPCHIRDFDESITIVRGTAVCLVQGHRYKLSGCDTAFLPKGPSHRFLNLSDKDTSMV